jgi:hypothetical protein
MYDGGKGQKGVGIRRGIKTLSIFMHGLINVAKQTILLLLLIRMVKVGLNGMLRVKLLSSILSTFFPPLVLMIWKSVYRLMLGFPR